MSIVIPSGGARDEWDEIPDEELEETVWERLEGLGDAVPRPLNSLVSGTISWSTWAASNSFWLARNTVWVVATTSMIMFLPYIIEKERSDLEKTQVAQQRQMLLGPSAAMQQGAPKPQ